MGILDRRPVNLCAAASKHSLGCSPWRNVCTCSHFKSTGPPPHHHPLASRRRSSCSRSPSASLHIKAIIFAICASSPLPSAPSALQQERRISPGVRFLNQRLRLSLSLCSVLEDGAVVLCRGPAAISCCAHLLRCRQGQKTCVYACQACPPPSALVSRLAG